MSSDGRDAENWRSAYHLTELWFWSSALQVGDLVWLKAYGVEGAILLCPSIPRKLKVRQTFMACPCREPRQNKRLHNWVRRCGKIGRR